MFQMGKLTPLNPKAVHLPTVLHEALETAFNVDERGSDRDSLQYVLRLDKDVPECVCVDSSLQRVIFNLASNGMKFCSAHGTVVVIVSYVSTSPSPSALSSSSAPSSSSSSPTSSQAGSSYPSSLNPSQKCDKDLPDPTPAPQMSHSHLHSHSHSHRDSGRDSGFFTFTVSNSYDSGSLSGKAEILKFLQFTGSATAAVGFGSDALNNNSSSSNNSNISSNINTNISSAKASRPIGTAVPRPHPLPDTSSLPSLSLSPVSSPRPDFPSDDRGGKEGTKEGLPPGPSGSQPAAPAPTHSRPPPLPDHSFSMKATERTGLQTAFNMVHVMGGRLECSQTSHDTKFFFTVKLDVAGAGDIISSRFNPVVSTASRRGSPITSNRPSPYSSRRTSPYTSRNASGRTSPHHSAGASRLLVQVLIRNLFCFNFLTKKRLPFLSRFLCVSASVPVSFFLPFSLPRSVIPIWPFDYCRKHSSFLLARDGSGHPQGKSQLQPGAWSRSWFWTGAGAASGLREDARRCEHRLGAGAGANDR